MPVNNIGQNIQLLLNQTQGADIAKAVQPGEVVQARVAELLTDNRAIIQVKGINLLATLPTPAPGQAFLKGSLLSLAVLQAKPGQPSAPASAPTQNASQPDATAQSAPALSLKLLGINLNSPASPSPSAALQQPGSQPLARPNFENFLIQAQVPLNSSNLQAAQSLSLHGLAVDKATLNSTVQTAESMIDVENAFQSSQVTGQGAQPVPQPAFPLQTVLAGTKAMLATLSTQPNHASDKPVLQRLISQIDDLAGKTSAPEHAAPSPAPPLDLNAQPASEIITTHSATQAQSPINSATLARQIQFAAVQVAGDPSNASQALQQLEAVLNVSALEPAPQNAGERPAPSNPVIAQNDAPSLAASVKTEVVAAVVHELSRSLSPETPLEQNNLLVKVDAFILRASQPAGEVADKIVLSLKNQRPAGTALPGGEIQNAQSAVMEALSQIRDSFIAQPMPVAVKNEAALQRAFEARSLGSVPQTSLDKLPREAVLDAVAFLKARDLPTTRSLVEIVATALGKTADLPATIQTIVAAEPQMAQGVLMLHPDLKQAFENLNQFLSENGIKLQDSEVGAQISNFVSKSGLNLENNLAKAVEPSLPASASLPAQNPESTLKALLLKLNGEVQRASNQVLAQASPEVAGRLEHLSTQINSALNTMHALALSARPTPAFDVTTVQMPVYLGGQMQSGQLSIYWKRGRSHELSAQDPVNVVFLLNTRGLGEVKVQLQVWKNECQCRVTVASNTTRDFIKGDTPALKTGFEKNTRFKLSSIDVTTQDAVGSALSLGLNQLPTALEGLLRPNGGAALNLTA